jgi:uncharacterized protein involved in exopolysaccharide biosynthesis
MSISKGMQRDAAALPEGLISLLRLIRRWPGVILSMVLVTLAVLGVRLQAADPVYEAQVKLQITAPQSEDVQLFDQYRSSSLRDEMTVARNNFSEVLRSREVYDRTTAKLGLPSGGRDLPYDMEIDSSIDSDFVYVRVRESTAQIAEQVANTHVNTAIEYYAEVRAKPATAVGSFLADELVDATKEFSVADNAMAEFQKQNGIAALESEMTTAQNVIQQLVLDRSRRMADGKETASIDTVIAKRREDLQRLVALQPQYNMLQEKVKQTHAKYQLLLDKYNEAVLKDETIRSVSYIQIVEPALAPLQPVSSHTALILTAALLGSLVLAVLLAFLLDNIVGYKAADVVAVPKTLARLRK